MSSVAAPSESSSSGVSGRGGGGNAWRTGGSCSHPMPLLPLAKLRKPVGTACQPGQCSHPLPLPPPLPAAALVANPRGEDGAAHGWCPHPLPLLLPLPAAALVAKPCGADGAAPQLLLLLPLPAAALAAKPRGADGAAHGQCSHSVPLLPRPAGLLLAAAVPLVAKPRAPPGSAHQPGGWWCSRAHRPLALAAAPLPLRTEAAAAARSHTLPGSRDAPALPVTRQPLADAVPSPGELPR